MPLFELNQIKAKSNLFLLDLFEHRSRLIAAEKRKIENANEAIEYYRQAIFYYQEAINKAINKIIQQPRTTKAKKEQEEYHQWLQHATDLHLIDGVAFMVAKQLEELGSFGSAQEILRSNEQLQSKITGVLQDEEEKLLITDTINVYKKKIEIDHAANFFKNKNSYPVGDHAQRVFIGLLTTILDKDLYLWVVKKENEEWLGKHYKTLLDLLPNIGSRKDEKTSVQLIREVRVLYQTLTDRIKDYHESAEEQLGKVEKNLMLVFEWKRKNYLQKVVAQIKAKAQEVQDALSIRESKVGFWSNLLNCVLTLIATVAYPIAAPITYFLAEDKFNSLNGYLGGNYSALWQFVKEHRWITFSVVGSSVLSIVFPVALPLVGGAILAPTLVSVATDVTMNLVGVSAATADERQLIRSEQQTEVVRSEQNIGAKQQETSIIIAEDNSKNNSINMRERVWGVLAKEYYQHFPRSNFSLARRAVADDGFPGNVAKNIGRGFAYKNAKFFPSQDDAFVPLNLNLMSRSNLKAQDQNIEEIKSDTFPSFLDVIDMESKYSDDVASHQLPQQNAPPIYKSFLNSEERESKIASDEEKQNSGDLESWLKFVNANLLITAVSHDCTEIIREQIRAIKPIQYQNNPKMRSALFELGHSSALELELRELLLDKIVESESFASLKGPLNESWFAAVSFALVFPSLKEKTLRASQKILDKNANFYEINPSIKGLFFENISLPVGYELLHEKILDKVLMDNTLALLKGRQGQDWLSWLVEGSINNITKAKAIQLIKRIFDAIGALKVVSPAIFNTISSLLASDQSEIIIVKGLLAHLNASQDLQALDSGMGKTYLVSLMKAANIDENNINAKPIFEKLLNKSSAFYRDHLDILECLMSAYMSSHVSEQLHELLLDKIIASYDFMNLETPDLYWPLYFTMGHIPPSLNSKILIAGKKVFKMFLELEDMSRDDINALTYLVKSKNIQRPHLDFILSAIITSEQFARFINAGDETWLHIIAKALYFPELKDKVHEAVNVLVSLGVTPYMRSHDGQYTVFYHLAINDHYNLSSILRPSNNNYEYFNCDKQIAELNDFLDEIKTNPKANTHLVILVGPSGTGKTSLGRSIPEARGYIVEEMPANENEDKYAYHRSATLVNQFNRIKKTAPHCLFMDQISSIASKLTNKAADPGSHNHAGIVDVMSIELSQLAGHKAAIIGTANTIDQVAEKIVKKAKVIIFDLPNVQSRLRFLEDRLRLESFDSVDIIEGIAQATPGWAFGQLSDFVASLIKEGKGSVISSTKVIEYFEIVRARFEMSYSERGLNVVAPKIRLPRGQVAVDQMVALDPDIEDCLDSINSLLSSSTPGRKCYALHGVPGVGKSSFGREVAEKNNVIFMSLKPGSYDDKTLTEVFELAIKCEKAVIFIDEFHTIFSNMLQLSALQSYTEGVDKPKGSLVVLGTTNFINKMPSALAERFAPLEFKLPTDEQRYEVFKHYLVHVAVGKQYIDPDTIAEENINKYVKASAGLAHRNIKELIVTAGRDIERFNAKGKSRSMLTAISLINYIDKELKIKVARAAGSSQTTFSNLSQFPAFSSSIHNFHSSGVERSSFPLHHEPVSVEEEFEEKKEQFMRFEI